MALLAESLVEEWLNRKRFFTVRGVKLGVSEMDILAIKDRRDSCASWPVRRGDIRVEWRRDERARVRGVIRIGNGAQQRATSAVAYSGLRAGNELSLGTLVEFIAL